MKAKKKTTKKRMTAKERKEKHAWDMEMYEREARQRTAWAHYGQQMSYIRATQEENEYQKAKYWGDEKKVKEIEHNRNNRTNNLVIY
jgi:hypothetical protein